MTRIYNSYFDKLPKIKYDINRSLVNPRYETVTNIFFRVRYLQEVLNNLSSYYTIQLDDGDTPEILAEKIYDDAGAAWMIILANQMIDSQWEWPLGYDAFNKYIISKYGSIENAQITAHHYNMVITRTIQPDNITTERKYIVNSDKLTVNNMTVPYNYYFPYVVTQGILTDNTNIKVDSTLYTSDSGAEGQDPGEYGLQPGSLAYTQYVNTYNVEGKTVTEIIKGESVTNYDYESELNDSRRIIKIIKKEHYNQMMSEFNELTGSSAPYRKRVR